MQRALFSCMCNVVVSRHFRTVAHSRDRQEAASFHDAYTRLYCSVAPRNDTQQNGASGGEALGMSSGSSRQEHHRATLLLEVHCLSSKW
jgi:hypothetical protein